MISFSEVGLQNFLHRGNIVTILLQGLQGSQNVVTFDIYSLKCFASFKDNTVWVLIMFEKFYKFIQLLGIPDKKCKKCITQLFICKVFYLLLF